MNPTFKFDSKQLSQKQSKSETSRDTSAAKSIPNEQKNKVQPYQARYEQTVPIRSSICLLFQHRNHTRQFTAITVRNKSSRSNEPKTPPSTESEIMIQSMTISLSILRIHVIKAANTEREREKGRGQEKTEGEKTQRPSLNIL